MSRIKGVMMNKEKGQLFPVALFGIALVSLTMLFVFNTSQLSSKKQRLNNAADAAAYSAAVLQARHLNSLAYTNRAMIANQVFIAQMVSIESYLNFLHVKTENLEKVPFIGQFFAPVNQAIQGVQEVSDEASTLAIDASLAANRLFAARQYAVTTLVAGSEIGQTAEKVLAANDAEIEMTDLGKFWLSQTATGWQNHFDRKDTNEDLIDKANLINDSRDPFTAYRSYSPEFAHDEAKIEKTGNTTLSWEETGGNVSFRWDALDILTILKKEDGFFQGWESWVPVAWTRRSISEDNTRFECPPETFGNCENNSRDGDTRLLARELENETLNPIRQFELQPYYELKESDDKDPRFPVRLAVRYKKSSVKTSDNIDGIGSPSPRTNGNSELAAGVFYQDSDKDFDEMVSVAKAEVYFRRHTEREDGADEFANTWNPYWSARLVDSTEERAAVLLEMGADI